MAVVESDVPGLVLLSRGTVRDVYIVDDATLLFVATDRLSAFDVVMTNVRTRARAPRRHAPPRPRAPVTRAHTRGDGGGRRHALVPHRA